MVELKFDKIEQEYKVFYSTEIGESYGRKGYNFDTLLNDVIKDLQKYEPKDVTAVFSDDILESQQNLTNTVLDLYKQASKRIKFDTSNLNPPSSRPPTGGPSAAAA